MEAVSPRKDWCRREESNLHYMASRTIDSTVGLRRRGGSAGTCTQLSEWRPLYRRPRCLNRQRSRGVIGGTCTRFGEGHGLVPRLLRHRPQSAWSESNTLLSLIGQPHDPRATGGKELVWVVGIAPTTSRTRTARSAPELHPYAPCLMAGIEPAAVTPHGGPTRGQAIARRQRIERCWPGFGVQAPRPEGDACRATGRIRTFASNLRRVVSRP